MAEFTKLVLNGDNFWFGEIPPQPITTPGIYYSSDLGLISLSSDGSTWTTIADKNLGATSVWNNGDTLSESKCGKYYQRGNNNGFAYTGNVTTSSSQVNAQNYGPNNYYSSSTFITRSGSPYNWDSSNNQNLRGATTGTNAAMRGPCAEGYHVPNYTEILALYNLFAVTWTMQNKFSEYLKSPLSGRRDRTSTVQYQGENSYWWSCTSNTDASEARHIKFSGSSLGLSSFGKVRACSIRPFKNDAVQPDENWTVIYQPS